MLLSEPKPSRPPAPRQMRAVEDAVAEARFGDRAEAGDRAGRRQAARLVFAHVGAGGSASSGGPGRGCRGATRPGGGHRRPRPPRPPGSARRDACGAGGPAAGSSHGASASGLTARSECGATPIPASAGRWRSAASAPSSRTAKSSGVVPEALLAGPQRPPVDAAELVVHRQEGQADPGLAPRRRRSARRVRRDWRRARRRAGGGGSGTRHWWRSPPPASPSAPARRSPRRPPASDGRGTGT